MDQKWMDQPGNVRPGEALDEPGLKRFLTKTLPDWEVNELTVRQFPSGFSNLTYLVSSGSNQAVLRRPPFGANIKSAHDMGREFGILSMLEPVYDKIPKVISYTDDPGYIGAPFYLMEKVEGVILRGKMPLEMIPLPDTMARIAGSLVNNLSALHRLPLASGGLAGFGKPEGYAERQVSGWGKRYFAAKTDEIPELEHAIRWLPGHIPAHSDAALIHNDYKYDNLVLDPDDWTKIRAVLDWEMATVGDPLMDLGTTLGYWSTAGDPPALLALQFNPSTLPGNPSRSELISLYEKASGKQVNDPVFYYVYGLFKIAVIAQQIYFRFKQGFTQDPRFGGLIHAVRACGEMAERAIRLREVD
ncbi:MAG TPA: phosphotransferase family protein [Flavilitoribacter sp.]|nr:phosphotransferase family protein [Flavilitoribacter sp.]